MRSSEEILAQAARDGTMDIAEWPRVLESMLQRLRDIVQNDFPLPTVAPTSGENAGQSIDPEVVASTPPRRLHSDSDMTRQDADIEMLSGAELNENENDNLAISQSSTKENDLPPEALMNRVPPPPAFEINRNAHVDSSAFALDESWKSILPPDLLSLYNSSIRTLERDFANSPPYTIQRLAELVLQPKKHYRFLPAYLRAFDRVVAVSSPVSDFPLPTLHASSGPGGFLTNGDATQSGGSIEQREGLGSDESLGGALLTPIPWLHQPTLGTAATINGSVDDNYSDSDSQGVFTPSSDSGSIEYHHITVNGVPSATSLAHTTPTTTSPTLSDQSDASSPGSSCAAPTDSQLREQGAVTQGELLRMEQEAGIVPLSQGSPRRHHVLAGNSALAVGREPLAPNTGTSFTSAIDSIMAEDCAPVPAENVTPHARGPRDIGMQDTGPQGPQSRVFAAASAGGYLGLDDAERNHQSSSLGSPPATSGFSTTASRDDGAAATTTTNAATTRADGRPGYRAGDVDDDAEQLRAAMDVEHEGQAARAEGDFRLDLDGRLVPAVQQHGRKGNESEEVTGYFAGTDESENGSGI